MNAKQLILVFAGLFMAAFGVIGHEAGTAGLIADLSAVPGAAYLLQQPGLAFIIGAVMFLFGMIERRPAYPVR